MNRWSRLVLALLLVAASCWVVWWSVVNGRAEQREKYWIYLGAAPLVGRNPRDGWDWRFGWSLVGAAVIGAVVVASCWRGWWWKMRQRWVLVAAALGAMVFATLLALTDGLDGLRHGAEHETEYLGNLATAPPAAEFVRTFLERINGYSVHVRGHPPGYVLLLKLFDHVGLDGVWPVVLLSIAATGVSAAAVLLTVRAVVGDEWMRRSAPLLIVAPYLVWMVTSADAVFAAVGTLGIAAVAHGTTRVGWQALGWGATGGLLFGVLLFLTYLGAVLLVIPAGLLLVALVRREFGALLVTLGGVAAGLVVVGWFWWAGFWWFDGVDATSDQYHFGTAQFRDWDYFVVGNIGAAIFAVGPATIVGLGTLRNRRMWVLVGGALVAITVSHLSRYTKAEVERIWLLFYPWVVIAAAGLIPLRRRVGALVVAVQATSAILLQAALVTKW